MGGKLSNILSWTPGFKYKNLNKIITYHYIIYVRMLFKCTMRYLQLCKFYYYFFIFLINFEPQVDLVKLCTNLYDNIFLIIYECTNGYFIYFIFYFIFYLTILYITIIIYWNPILSLRVIFWIKNYFSITVFFLCITHCSIIIFNIIFTIHDLVIDTRFRPR